MNKKEKTINRIFGMLMEMCFFGVGENVIDCSDKHDYHIECDNAGNVMNSNIRLFCEKEKIDEWYVGAMLCQEALQMLRTLAEVIMAKIEKKECE